MQPPETWYQAQTSYSCMSGPIAHINPGAMGIIFDGGITRIAGELPHRVQLPVPENSTRMAAIADFDSLYQPPTDAHELPLFPGQEAASH